MSNPYLDQLSQEALQPDEWAVVNEQYHHFEGTTLTVCCLQFANGAAVIGESASGRVEHFDAELGRRYAKQSAIRQSSTPDVMRMLACRALGERLHRPLTKDELDKIMTAPPLAVTDTRPTMSSLADWAHAQQSTNTVPGRLLTADQCKTFYQLLREKLGQQVVDAAMEGFFDNLTDQYIPSVVDRMEPSTDPVSQEEATEPEVPLEQGGS